MTELYAVTVCQDLPITKIEGAGKKSTGVFLGREYTVLTYQDCTYPQVMFYRKTYPNAEITIQQTSGFKPERDKRPKVQFGKTSAPAPKRERPAPAPVAKETFEHGSYADVINKMMDGE